MAANDKNTDGDEAPPKKSKKKLIIILLVLFMLLGAGGGGAYWWFFMRAPAIEGEVTEETQETAAAEGDAALAEGEAASADGQPRIERQSNLPRSAGKVLPLPPFVVNLSDAAGKRYLRLGMEVEVNKDVSQALKTQNAKIRDAVIVLLAGKTFADVSSAEGKILLKAEVASRLNQILGGAYVVRVYFTEFVVEQ